MQESDYFRFFPWVRQREMINLEMQPKIILTVVDEELKPIYSLLGLEAKVRRELVHVNNLNKVLTIEYTE